MSEQITDRQRLLGLLEALRSDHALLSARREGEETWYNTTLLKIDSRSGALYLDELCPQEGHQRLQVGDILHLVGVLQGVPTHFRAPITDTGVQNGIAFYRAALPDQLDYQQRRAFFRAYVSRGLNLTVHLRTEDDVVASGRLQDISLGGFGALLPENIPVHALDVLAVDSLELPGAESIRCNAQIRYVQQEPAKKMIRVGALLTELHPPGERLLLRAIMTLEREQIRKQARE